MVSSWYTPRPGARSMLVVDTPASTLAARGSPQGRHAEQPGILLAPDPALGKPLAARRLGRIEAYVYSYDIASRLERPRCDFAWAHPC
jgi:hypothetical protein